MAGYKQTGKRKELEEEIEQDNEETKLELELLNFRVPAYTGWSLKFDQEDMPYPIMLDVNRWGTPTALCKDGKYRLDNPDKVLDFFTQHRDYTVCVDKGVVDSLLKTFPYTFCEELVASGDAIYKGYEITRINNLLRFKKDKVHNLWNLKDFSKTKLYDLDDLASFPIVFLETLAENGLSVQSLISYPGIGRTNILKSPKTFFDWKKITPDFIARFERCGSVIRHETAMLGTEDAYSLDIHHAHAQVLRHMPSAHPELNEFFESADYIAGDSYAAYDLDYVLVPPDFTFPPVPYYMKQTDFDINKLGPKLTKILVWPWGTLRNVTVAKPIMDLIINLGLKHHIRMASHILPVGKPYYGFRSTLNKIETAIKNIPADFMPKKLYNTIGGSFGGAYSRLNKETGEVERKALSTFNPVYKSHIHAAVEVAAWIGLFESRNPLNFRVDGGAAKGPVSGNKVAGLYINKQQKGEMTQFNPILKDLPGEEPCWRLYMQGNPDKDYIELPIEFTVTLDSAVEGSRGLKDVGRRFETSQRLFTTGGSRILERKPRNAELLRYQVPVRQVSINELEKLLPDWKLYEKTLRINK